MWLPPSQVRFTGAGTKHKPLCVLCTGLMPLECFGQWNRALPTQRALLQCLVLSSEVSHEDRGEELGGGGVGGGGREDSMRTSQLSSILSRTLKSGDLSRGQ